MAKQLYVARKFSPASELVIERANAIIEEYAAQGYDLTLRQLYYQFVARDFLPNTLRSYKNLGSVVNDARLAGLIDWDRIEDRTRNLRQNGHWANPAAIVRSAASSFALDKWDGQEYRPEVWVEKEALAGVFQGVCDEEDVAWFSCRGYVSQSELRAAGERWCRYQEAGQTVVILHFGDHDPSGIDMTRDITDRMNLFTKFSGNCHEVDVRRLALNMDQVEQYAPPPNPAKATDARYEGYRREYGDESWELDALEPAALVELARAEISSLRDDSAWGLAVERETRHRELLTACATNWRAVTEFLRDQNG